MSENASEITNMPETVEKISRDFFSAMGIGLDGITVETEEEKRRIYRVTVKTPDSKILIGVHGQTLEHLRHLLTRLVERTVGKSFLLHLEVNDYLQTKDERLLRRVDERIESLLRTGGELSLDLGLSSYERKKVHSHIADKNIEGLSTKSSGEGESRTLHLIYSGTPKVTETVSEPRSTSYVPRPPSVRMDGSDLSEDGIGI